MRPSISSLQQIQTMKESFHHDLRIPKVEIGTMPGLGSKTLNNLWISKSEYFLLLKDIKILLDSYIMLVDPRMK